MSEAGVATPAVGRLRWRTFNWREYVVYIGFVLVFLFFAIYLGENFLNWTNLSNIVIQTAPITVMAVGLVFVLSTGEIDLSIGSVVAVSALTGATVVRDTDSMILGAAAGLAVGAIVGLVNGFFVTIVRLPSFLVTLATMGAVAGVARQISNLQSVPVTNDSFVGLFGSGNVFGIPGLIIWSVVAIAIGYLVLKQTRYGAHVLAIGDNVGAARVSGIKVTRVKIMVMVGSAMCASLAGLLYAGRLHGARYTLGEADLMTVIAAVIVGGTSLFGGKGAIVGALMGSLLMGMLNNGLILANLSVSQQMIARGVIILIAVSLSLREKRS
ncbi:ABC transporter permease [Planosporangium flavigriseum]|uniref:ABC transporter permease n=1 Tax=Planosporangium flavigriseum TaxID=373681 RepID=A0A8J3LEA1_9ACTN|nr:ABC transporter permease [Planosporangium flavigriseum]NJC65224.1 ABC transporter permease [Planosporangium flavigriseum]GIG71843.1 ABC transporter permease [Planosporangium flavigriseum]